MNIVILDKSLTPNTVKLHQHLISCETESRRGGSLTQAETEVMSDITSIHIINCTLMTTVTVYKLSIITRLVQLLIS